MGKNRGFGSRSVPEARGGRLAAVEPAALPPDAFFDSLPFPVFAR